MSNWCIRESATFQCLSACTCELRAALRISQPLLHSHCLTITTPRPTQLQSTFPHLLALYHLLFRSNNSTRGCQLVALTIDMCLCMDRDRRDREDREDRDRQDKGLGVDRERERGRKPTTSYSTRSPAGVCVRCVYVPCLTRTRKYWQRLLPLMIRTQLDSWWYVLVPLSLSMYPWCRFTTWHTCSRQAFAFACCWVCHGENRFREKWRRLTTSTPQLPLHLGMRVSLSNVFYTPVRVCACLCFAYGQSRISNTCRKNKHYTDACTQMTHFKILVEY